MWFRGCIRVYKWSLEGSAWNKEFEQISEGLAADCMEAHVMHSTPWKIVRM